MKVIKEKRNKVQKIDDCIKEEKAENKNFLESLVNTYLM